MTIPVSLRLIFIVFRDNIDWNLFPIDIGVDLASRFANDHHLRCWFFAVLTDGEYLSNYRLFYYVKINFCCLRYNLKVVDIKRFKYMMNLNTDMWLVNSGGDFIEPKTSVLDFKKLVFANFTYVFFAFQSADTWKFSWRDLYF